MSPSRVKSIIIFALVALGALLISQWINYPIRTSWAVGETHIINSWIWLTYVRNYGGIFGSFQGSGWVFAIVSLILLAVLVAYLFRAKTLNLYHAICFGLITGGGASNILDRLLHGAVIDYINIQNIPYWKYIFNAADTMIHLGIWPLILLTWLERRKHDPSSSADSKGDRV